MAANKEQQVTKAHLVNSSTTQTYSQIRRIRFNFANVDGLVRLVRIVARLQSANQVESLERGQERIDASHETFEKDDLGQAQGEHLEIARKIVEIIEILQLHGSAEIERQVFEIGTLVGQIVQQVGSDQINGQFDVLERLIEPVSEQVQEVVIVTDVNRVLELGPKLESSP